MMSKIVCAISGGVDSAVAALLLKQKGYKVLGAFMRNWDLRDETGHCSMEEDHHYAERVCSTLKIPFHCVNFVKEYWNNVFEETIDEYEYGRTPNPDVLCNQHIKFDAFLKYAKSKLNTPTIATGHYARTSENFLPAGVQSPNDFKKCHSSHTGERNDGCLYKAIDENKDQTFFLNKISSYALKHTIFPLGSLYKDTVKTIASKNNLGFIAKRKESMGICFIGLRDFDSFIQDYIQPKAGNFVLLETGELMGAHNGYFKYTIGQRSRISGSHVPYFVVGKNIQSGDIFVAGGTNHLCLFSNALIMEAPHWISEGHVLSSDINIRECEARLMHREPLVCSKLYELAEGKCLLILKQPLRAITPGQAVVLYSGNKCLGGSKILNVGPSVYECANNGLKFAPYRCDSDIWYNIFHNYGDQILPCSPNIMDDINDYQNMLKKYN
uniref:mitochondrial tRNA-specific 2-thiouridylase 1-like isoform X2 n=1 Tax=Styela clava TaxID=7725 RepID=UPI0019394EBD|nr:mitochondrial tRNA-specific 2-thiouridylase 1-like isoform X2 [Styela clava]